ncbi:hypothetical protein Nmel_008100 [Mimus melanotis]
MHSGDQLTETGE